ncbi:MAG: hypothetical protein KBF90_05070 [Coprothermobacter sp.]|nr:hypothetical protein [Coprothermobacter proteolyticus]MBP8984083.1 hypothetical protein [Coprothermobacter sp.]
MEKPIWYHSEYSFELLENIAIFRLKPILCIGLDHVLFLKKGDSLVIITPKSQQRLVARSIMELANAKELQLYLEDLSFSHSCVRKTVKSSENDIIYPWDLIPNSALEGLPISKRLNGEIVIQ